MSVSKGDKITAADINTLINALNSEAERRGYSGRVDTVSENEPISYDTINAINKNRIEITKIYRATSLYSDIKDCTQRSDGAGTPSTWNGSDLTTTVLNTGEAKLAKGNKAYASQYNTLLSDVTNMAAMCACNSYHKSTGWFMCTIWSWCNCNKVCTEFAK